MRLEIFILQSLEHCSEKSTDDELRRMLRRNAAGHHVEEFVLIEFSRGRPVRAAHVVGKDFQAGHGVRLGLITQHQVPDLLVGVGFVGGFLDLDQACKDGP